MVRFGIIGFGLHGRKRLLPAFQQTQRAKLVAISRRGAEKARDTAREIGVPYSFGTVEELCASPEVDAVFVSSSNVLHLEHVLLAIDSGKAVLCEKPMAMNAGEAEKMVSAAAERGVPFGVAQVFRFHRTVLAVRDLIASGRIGAPVAARSDFTFPGRTHQRTWLRNAASGGGIMADVGVHCIDALRFALGDEVDSAHGEMSFCDGGADDTAAATLRFRRGTIATVTNSLLSPYFTHLEIAGEDGRIVAPYAFEVAANRIIELHSGETREQIGTYDNRRSYIEMIDAFADTVADGNPFVCPGEDALRTQQVLDAVYRSARTGGIEERTKTESQV